MPIIEGAAAATIIAGGTAIAAGTAGAAAAAGTAAAGATAAGTAAVGTAAASTTATAATSATTAAAPASTTSTTTIAPKGAPKPNPNSTKFSRKNIKETFDQCNQKKKQFDNMRKHTESKNQQEDEKLHTPESEESLKKVTDMAAKVMFGPGINAAEGVKNLIPRLGM